MEIPLGNTLWKENSDDPKKQAMLLSAELLYRLRHYGFEDKNSQQFSDLFQKLKALRDKAPHEVNQGLRAFINIMVYGPARNQVLQEIIHLIEKIVIAVISRKISDSSIDVSRGNIEDILQTAWLKESQKYSQLVHLEERLKVGEKLSHISNQEFKGLFNPLQGDFLSWFTRVAMTKGLDIVKMSSREGKRKTRWLEEERNYE